MAFVNETISEADKPTYLKFGFKSPFNREVVPPWKWTIDRDRGAFLVSLGGEGGEQSEIPAFYALVWKDQVVSFRAFTKGRGDYQSGAEIWWNIFSVRIPESLANQKDYVLDLVREAVDARGSGYRRDHIRAVHIDIEAARER